MKVVEKKCVQCLHKKVCVDYRNIKEVLSKTNTHAFNDKDSIINNIAKECNNYLVYDERSTDVLLQKSKSARRYFEWCISMCKNGSKVDKTHLLNRSDLWFKDNFVDSLEKGFKDLDYILKEDD